MKLELLSPAKNLECGRAAVDHGADALYVGAPAFGARAAATNSLADLEALVRYAHFFRAKVFATVNTLLFDDELDAAVAMIRRLYEMGVDAIIVQDLGLLECDLPPIELHASTQCHNASLERVKFLQSAGFRRVILARETTLEQMRVIRRATTVELEAFVHGALCVSYSGQCYMSQYLGDRSGNRGCCSQPCRSRYDLVAGDGRTLVRDRHLLSLKDFNASALLADMVDAGITSFKIEGRLKDLAYVKNITAHYRRLIDGLMEGHGRASSGVSTFWFEPDPERTFNRGYTDYFLERRQPMASLATQKSLGKRVGEVVGVGRNGLVVKTIGETLAAGDGLCYFDDDGCLQGFLVNKASKHQDFGTSGLQDIELPRLRAQGVDASLVGKPLWRNHDHAFERRLQGNTAVRKVRCTLTFDVADEGFALKIDDEDGVSTTAMLAWEHEEASNRERARKQMVHQLAKLGDSPLVATQVVDATEGRYFLRAAAVNRLRREAVEKHIEHRIGTSRPSDTPLTPTEPLRVSADLDYRANVVNAKAEAFYRRHGAQHVEYGLEKTLDYDGKALMTTKYCLRFELGCCLKKKESAHGIAPTDTLFLRNQGRLFRLGFDCRQCLMRIYADTSGKT